MNRLIQDVRYSLRQLRKAPGFTVMVVADAGAGDGANAAIFTLVNAVLIRNLPVADPKTLVHVGDTDECCVEGRMPEHNDYSISPTTCTRTFATTCRSLNNWPRCRQARRA